MSFADQRIRWRLLGPGIIVAATGVGSGDLVATLIAGERFGYQLLWAVIAGCIVKAILAEGTGRWHLATGRTIFEGWASLGAWARAYFGVYIVIWGLVYGAAGMSASALPLAALFPIAPLWVWAVASGVAGLVFVWLNRYPSFERMMAALAGVMFITGVGLAAAMPPGIGDVASGIAPTLPPGSAIYTLGLIGGVGGTITMAAYGYWAQAKGWTDSRWMGVMRQDNAVAYTVTGVFVLSMLVVGAELLHGRGLSLTNGDRGLLDLSQILGDRFGRGVAVMFLVGFWATAFTSVLGVWNGVSLLFADFVDHLRPQHRNSAVPRERSVAFRAYLCWLTFVPMLLLFLGRPFQLVLAYGVLGSMFMPFLAITLLLLLNSTRVPPEWRNGPVSNTGLVIAALLFGIVSVRELVGLLSGFFDRL
jgi:Mn2+/Fe2+ NRAMP family transporter